MVYLWLSILVLFNAVSLVLVVFGLPGNWLIVAGTSLFAWWQWDAGVFSVWTLVAVAAMALLAELVEFSAGTVGARKAGASWRGSMAAVLGVMVGAIGGTFMISFPFLGTVVGASLGAGLAVWAAETSRGQRSEHSLRRGLSAGLGALIGIVGKLTAGVMIWLTVTVAAFWP